MIFHSAQEAKRAVGTNPPPPFELSGVRRISVQLAEEYGTFLEKQDCTARQIKVSSDSLGLRRTLSGNRNALL